MADVQRAVEAGSAPTGRVCSRCNAANAPAAGFCWQCYAPLSGPSASAGPAAGAPSPTSPPALTPGVPAVAPGGVPAPQTEWGGRPGMPGPAGWPAPGAGIPQPVARSNARLPQVLGAIVGIAVCLATYLVVSGKLFHHTPDLPRAVGSSSLISNPQLDAGIDVARRQMSAAGIEGDLAFYGASSTPEFMLMWALDPSESPDVFFSGFAAGFSSTSGGTVDTASLETQAAGGTTYFCAPVAGGFSGGICMWQDGDVYWLVFDARQGAGGIQATRELTVQAKSAVDAA